MVLLVPLVASLGKCQSFCAEPCDELNEEVVGDVAVECGGCDATFACSPPGAAEPPPAEPRAPPPGLSPPPLPPPSQDGDGAAAAALPHTLELLWPSAFYSASLLLLPGTTAMTTAMSSSHNEQLAAIVTRRFEDFAAARDPAGAADGYELNEWFHDAHRPQLRRSFQEEVACVRQGGWGKAAECEAAAAASSVWPELLSSPAFRALFGLERGLVWQHYRQYAASVTAPPGSTGALPHQLPDFDLWATYQRGGMGHASHSHDGSSFAGVYYVRTNADGGGGGEEEEEAGGALRVNDPRHIRLGGGALRGIGASDRVLRPRPGQLAFWPAYLQHEVTPTAGSSARISFAMDLKVPGVDAPATPDAVWPQRLDREATPPRTPPAPEAAAGAPPDDANGNSNSGHGHRPDEHVRCTPGCASSSCASLGGVPGADPGRLLTLAQECGACGPAKRCNPARFTPLQSEMLRERLAGRTSRQVFVKYRVVVVADAAEELLPDDATDDADGAFALKPFLCAGMPQWMRRAITTFSGDGVEVRGSGSSADGAAPLPLRACPLNGPPLPEQPPANAGPAAARPVASERGLTAADFYRRYARPGVPVLLRGALLDPDAAGRAKALRECCAREYAHKAGVARAKVAAAGTAAAASKCDIYDPHTWCARNESVQLCGRHPEFACAVEAGALYDARRLPAPLRRLLELPAPLPSLERITERFRDAYIFWSRPADTFGGPDHFDVICTGTLSMQHRGRKRWTLWAPWELADADGGRIPAHTRFEVVVGAGDVLYYPPAWFHGTVVEEGGGGGDEEEEEEEGSGDESISVAVDLEHVPAYGSLAGRSLRTPFGYGSCAAGANGWYAQSEAWDEALLGAEQREDEL
jgi:hypothetical protein